MFIHPRALGCSRRATELKFRLASPDDPFRLGGPFRLGAGEVLRK